MQKSQINLNTDEIADFVGFLNKTLKIEPMPEIINWKNNVTIYNVTPKLGLSVYIDGDNSKFWFWEVKHIPSGPSLCLTCSFSMAFKEIFNDPLISDSFKTFISFYLDKI